MGSRARSRAGVSADFLLRVYRVRVGYERARRGPEDGRVDVLDFVQLRDPDDRIPFPIVTEGSPERLLTAPTSIPSRCASPATEPSTSGDEFGPFLLHTDRTGRVLEAPIATPGVRAPENESSEPPTPVNLRSSSGFEGMSSRPIGASSTRASSGRPTRSSSDRARLPPGLRRPIREGSSSTCAGPTPPS